MSVETKLPLETDVVTKQLDDIHPVSRYFLFLGKDSVKRNFMWFPLAGMIICIILGIYHPQKHPLPYEQYIPGSWAIWGFVAYSLIVLSANTLFKLLGRDESYYGEGGLPDPDYSTDPMVTGEAHHD
jgi:hypothetical protein